MVSPVMLAKSPPVGAMRHGMNSGSSPVRPRSSWAKRVIWFTGVGADAHTCPSFTGSNMKSCPPRRLTGWLSWVWLIAASSPPAAVRSDIEVTNGLPSNSARFTSGISPMRWLVTSVSRASMRSRSFTRGSKRGSNERSPSA